MCVKASDRQIGGTHYKFPLQPFEFSLVNPEITGVEFSVIRYLMRAHSKNGLQDLEKAKHCVEFVKEMLDKYSLLRKRRPLSRLGEFVKQFKDMPVMAHASLVEFLISIEDGHSEWSMDKVINTIDIAMDDYQKEDK